MPLKRPIKIVQKGGQTQVMRGKPTGDSGQDLVPQDLSQEIPNIEGVVAKVNQALSGLVEEQRRGCGCGG